jgi:hypothetical protein
MVTHGFKRACHSLVSQIFHTAWPKGLELKSGDCCFDMAFFFAGDTIFMMVNMSTDH